MNNVKWNGITYDFPVPEKNKKIKQTYAMRPTSITVHNTWNTAGAKAEASYMVGNSNWTSFHTVVDETCAIECIPFDRNAWHAGQQTGNLTSIGVEIARSRSDLETFKKAELNGARYIAGVLYKFGWGLDKLKKHQDWSGKYCPHRTLDLGYQRFRNMVQKELDLLKSGKTASPSNTRKGGFSVKVDIPSNDVLNVRDGAGVEYKKVSTYRPNSIIWVEEITKDINGKDWYKIPKVGYVSSDCCKKIENKVENKMKEKIVLYKGDGDKDTAELLAKLLDLKCYPDNGTVNAKDYDYIYVGGQGKNRRETAKIVFNKYL